MTDAGESAGRSGRSGPDPPGAANSRRIMPMTPATPDAAEESEMEYFPSLEVGVPPRVPSRNSSIFPSSLSVAGSDSIRPARDQARRPSIRIRRVSRDSNASIYQQAATQGEPSSSQPASSDAQLRNRPRSISQPTASMPAYPDASIARHSRRTPQIALPRLTEEGARPTAADMNAPQSPISPTRSLPEDSLGAAGRRPSSAAGSEPATGKLNRKRKLSRLLWPGFNTRQPPQAPTRSEEFDEELVDWLDIIDPEVQTLSTLTNVQNSLFVPDLGSWVNRRPTYVLSQYEPELRPPVPRPERPEEPLSEEPEEPQGVSAGAQPEPSETARRVPLRRSDTITSRLTESHYAALPHGITLQGWSDAEKLELDDHVRHMLHSRRSRFKRMMKGFGQYVRRPLGFFVTLYATLITLFGLAWVLFLIGWIYVGDKQVYTIHIIDSVLVALFAVMGDGLAPFRAVDTYHMIFVVRYSRMIAKAKKKKQKKKREARSRRSSFVNQPEGEQSMELTQTGSASTEELATHVQGPLASQNAHASVERIAASTGNIVREPRAVSQNFDIEGAKLDVEYDEDSPLTYAQWKSLRHHQKKLARSHSFYKPDETFTHNPFPLAYLIAIVILLDCHSCLQISLGATTWGIDYHHRPIVITTVILCVSITCNLTAGLVITIGDRKTRKKEVKKLLDRQELTGDAIKHLENKRAKEQSRSHDSTEENQQERALIKEV